MDLPADPSTSTSAPPLPYQLQTSGIGWLVAALVLVGLTLAIFARSMRDPAVAVTVVDDAVVGWLAGLVGPCSRSCLPQLLEPPQRLVSGSSWLREAGRV
jgi:hypothetical protein